MNEALYSWTFKFHKVVRQQNSGAAEDFISLHSAVYLRIQKWKNYWNRSTFAKVVVKIKVAPFSMAHGSNNTIQSNKTADCNSVSNQHCSVDSQFTERLVDGFAGRFLWLVVVHNLGAGAVKHVLSILVGHDILLELLYRYTNIQLKTNNNATRLHYTVSQKNCANVIFWITPWNVGGL